MKRKICIVIDSRAEYGHLYWLMKAIQSDPRLVLQIVACGAHLSPKYGLTYRVMEKDGFKIDRKLKTLLYPDTEVGIAKMVGIACQKFAEAFEQIKPDIIVILGDRYEMIAAALTAHIARIPIAHIGGGETTEGAIDEAFRHAITKMATLHFVSTEIYRRRVIQLGEQASFVFNFGAPGLDNLFRVRLMDKEALSKDLGIDLSGKTALVTCHPVTLESKTSKEQIVNLLKAINAFDIKAVFTSANADTDGEIINAMIRAFCQRDPKKYKYICNLGQIRYFSCLQCFDLMIGNSSSGIIEAPSFGIPVVNIGDRQKGRIRAGNIIDVGYSSAEIGRGIKRALSPKFKKRAQKTINPYDKHGDGNVSYRVKDVLKIVPLYPNMLKKKFNDISGEK